MRRIHRAAHIEADVGRFLEKQPADPGRAVFLVAPFIVPLIVLDIVFRVFNDAVDRDDAFGDKVDPLNGGDGRNVTAFKVEGGNQGPVQVFCGDG